MGDFAFGKDFGMMESSEWHPAVIRQQRALALLAPANGTIWLVRAAFSFVPFLGKVKDWMQMVTFCEDRMAKRMLRVCCALCYMGWLVATGGDTGWCAG